MAKKPEEGKIPTIYFDSKGGGYWLQLASGRFLQLDTGQVKLHLREAGLSKDEYVGPLNEIEKALYVSQVERFVDYAGPLSGHRPGMFVTTAGERILVTSDFVLPAPKPGKLKVLDKFLTELFGAEQLEYVLLWLKLAYESLAKGDFRPGQLLVLAGPSACGKSLFQALVTEILGGRSGRPFRYMTGETQFNSDLAQAEHLMIEDENASADIRSRRKFGTSIKEFTVNTMMSVHAKGRQAITLPCFKRLTLSVNSEHENLMILPPMDESLLDKITLLKCNRASVGDDRKTVWQNLTAEIPALVAMFKSLRVRTKLRDDRFGIGSFHHPELFAILCDISPEARLQSLIEEVIFAGDDPPEFWSGSAEQLEKRLRNSPFAFAVEKLLYFSSAAGTYLGRLASRNPNRYESRKNEGKTKWIIKP